MILNTNERRGIVSTYTLLLTLTPEGRQWILDDPESLQHAEEATDVASVEVLGLCGVLGEYDFVSIVEAPDNESVAAFSVELGVRAGAHISTLPAIPIARFDSDPRVRAAAADRVRGVRGEPGRSERNPRFDP